MSLTLHIQLLGGFRLRVDDTPGTTLDHPRLQALLAYLLLHRTAPHVRTHLAFLLWPDTTEAQARANLRTLLHRLRHALPDADSFLHADAQVVQWRGDAPWTLDVLDFERAVALADQAERAGRAALRSGLEQAVALYRGDLLPGWYDDWVLLERERLRQAFLAALERLIAVLEQEQDYPAAVSYAQRLLRHDPLHEVAYQHLMRLQALSGDRASALRIYQSCVTVLERELGVEPSPATREAYAQLLRPQASLPVPSGRPTSPAPRAQQHNLPVALTSFIGRARELTDVRGRLATTRLLTLTGAGGCGKTRLALAVANELMADFPDGVWFVELASLADPALVPQAVATVLGVREEPQRLLAATLVDVLRSRTLLLLLDNCEHLIAACAQLAQTLLSTCPQLRILATSRETLSIAGETAWLVPSLSLPDPGGRLRDGADLMPALLQSEAVRLFVERAAATLPTFALTQQNALDVAQICQRLDGIPLAIELAAARVKVLSVTQIAARLDDCFRLLTGGSRTTLPRHQTLRAALDWSHDLLSEPERALFRRLAIFAGGWTLEAAEVVCADKDEAGRREDAIAPLLPPSSCLLHPSSVLELLAHLVDKSLVVVDASAAGAVRYRLLETVRQYSYEKLREAEEAEALAQQHANFFVALAEAAEPELRGPHQVAWLNRLEVEHDNIRAALTWSFAPGAAPERVEHGLQLVVASHRYWQGRGHVHEGFTWLERGLQANDPISLAIRASALDIAGWLVNHWGDGQRAIAMLQESIALYRRLNDEKGVASGLDVLGDVAWRNGDFAAAKAYYDESLALYRKQADPSRIGLSLYSAGRLHVDYGYYEEADSLLSEGLSLLERISDWRGVALCLNALGRLALFQGDARLAAARFREALRLNHKLGHKVDIAECLQEIAVVAMVLGKEPHATRLWSAATALRETIGVSLPTNDPIYLRAADTWLSEAVSSSAWAEGHAMSLDQAIEYALAAEE